MTMIDNLRGHIPPYERNNALFNAIFEATATELNKTGGNVEQNDNELFIDTAIQALDLHERDLGIPKNTMSLSQRREQIMLYFLKAYERITEETLEKMADFYTDGKSTVKKSERSGIYEFIFNDGSVPYDNPEFQLLLDKVMPAFFAWAMASKNQSEVYTAAVARIGMKVRVEEG